MQPVNVVTLALHGGQRFVYSESFLMFYLLNFFLNDLCMLQRVKKSIRYCLLEFTSLKEKCRVRTIFHITILIKCDVYDILPGSQFIDPLFYGTERNCHHIILRNATELTFSSLERI